MSANPGETRGHAVGTRFRSEVYETRVVSRPPTEAELVERARDGDSAAFTALVRDHQEIAFRTAYLITRNAADAEDAAQVGLTKAWRALPRFRRGAPVRPWLLAIVANEARNRRRAEGRREGLFLRAVHELPPGDAAPSPEGRIVAAEERAELLAALERLSEDDRLVISCRFLLDLGEGETAAVLALRRGTVKSRTSRALERLRTQLEAKEVDRV
jgi:RNA polymerase sigma-70 factor (ECF subfamily)